MYVLNSATCTSALYICVLQHFDSYDMSIGDVDSSGDVNERKRKKITNPIVDS